MKTIETIDAPGNGPAIPIHAFIPDGEVQASLLFVPALGVKARYYDTFGETLAGHGVAVGVMEIRGHGESSVRASHGNDWGYRDLALEDLPAARSWLSEQVAAPKNLVGGHSLGGQLSMIFASHHPDRADGIVCIATGSPHHGHFNDKQKRGIKFAIIAAPIMTRALGYFPGERLGFGGREAKTLMDDWAGLAKHDEFRFRGLDGPLEPLLASYQGPLLTFAFADDFMGPPSAVASMYNKMACANHQHHVLSEEELGCRADHFKWAKSPEAPCVRIAEWIAQIGT